MRNAIPFLVIAVLIVPFAVFTTGCAGPEEKLGRGVDNTLEVVRMGELRRSIEQTAVFDTPDVGYTAGFIHGVDRTVARTGLGIFEIVTFPLPPYQPIATKYFTPNPPYPASYKPGLMSDSLFDTDTYIGFSGGDVMPFVPGSRFRVFDN
jgi:putative exosortase-associated protein (TIGR04073 family)